MRRLQNSWVCGCTTWLQLHVSLRLAASAAAPLVDHYRRLNVDLNATAADIKSAYRRCALVCHPDVVEDGKKAAAEAEFRRVSESYAILSDTQQRSQYDAEYRRAFPAAARKAAAATKKTTVESPTSSSAKQAKGSSTKYPTSTRSATASETRPGATPHRRSSSSAASPSPPPNSDAFRRQRFVRKDADRAFRDAFDGKTLAEVLFAARKKEHQRVAAQRTSGSTTGRGAPQPAGHDEALARVAALAAEKFADRVKREFGHTALHQTKLVSLHHAPARGPAPGTKMPFRPFVGMRVPPGIEVPPEPVLGPTTHVNEEPVVAMQGAPRPSAEESQGAPVHPDARNTRTRAETLRRLKSETDMPHNMGQMYSYHRPY